MVQKTVIFNGELPKTSTEKIYKFVLKEIAMDMGPFRQSWMWTMMGDQNQIFINQFFMYMYILFHI